MAQSVERRIGSAEVTGPIPVTSLKKQQEHPAAFSHYPYSSHTSGIPATDVSTETIPASTAVPATIFQSTWEIDTAAGMSATAVCAIVLIARIPAAFNHLFVLILSLKTQFFIPLPPCNNKTLSKHHALSRCLIYYKICSI